MNILVCGAHGFVGQHITQALTKAGYQVIYGVRHNPNQYPQHVSMDFTRNHTTSDWLPRVKHVDVVINAVGILREPIDVHTSLMQAIHVHAPLALFDACVIENQLRHSLGQSPIKVVHISALGADETAKNPYSRTKGQAETILRRSKLPALILRPSLIYGKNGASARWFRNMARLPIIAVAGQGESQVQPVHIEDVVAAILRFLSEPQPPHPTSPSAIPPHCLTLDAVGPRAVSYREMMSIYHQAYSPRRALFIPIPWRWLEILAKLSQALTSSLLDATTLALLRAGNCADVTPFANWLGYSPRAIETFINGD